MLSLWCKRSVLVYRHMLLYSKSCNRGRTNNLSGRGNPSHVSEFWKVGTLFIPLLQRSAIYAKRLDIRNSQVDHLTSYS